MKIYSQVLRLNGRIYVQLWKGVVVIDTPDRQFYHVERQTHETHTEF